MGLFSILGLGAKLIGASKQRKAQRRANAANSPAGQRAQYEEAGFNPVPFMLGGGYIPQQAVSVGDTYAEAGSFFERQAERNHEQKIRETELAKENENLREALDDLARPQQPGYIQQYGGILPLPSVGDAYADANSVSHDSNIGVSSGISVPSEVPPNSVPVDADGSPRNRDLLYFGNVIDVDETTSPAEKFEDEYGEIGGGIAAIPHLVNDAYWGAVDYGLRTYREWQIPRLSRQQALEHFRVTRTARRDRERAIERARTEPMRRDRYYFEQNPRRY